MTYPFTIGEAKTNLSKLVALVPVRWAQAGPPGSLKELLLEIPDVGEDSDFERPSDGGPRRGVVGTGVECVDPFADSPS